MSNNVPQNKESGVPRRSRATWRDNVYEVIFGVDTPMGKLFDVFLIIFILLSVVLVIIGSISEVQIKYGSFFYIAEWFFTIAFTIEYFLRIISVYKIRRYTLSFFGIIDLISIIPTYLSLFFVGAQALLVLRALRLLRIFRIFKLVRYVKQAHLLSTALRASSRKIAIFLITVFILTIIMGALMFIVEGGTHGFANIPQSIYWTIVTLTTVGYGDIVPITPLGKAFASIVMLMGYGIIAVPTGIVSVEIAQATRKLERIELRACKTCDKGGQDPDAKYCKFCGAKL